ncbi:MULTISPECIES: hypothetical protein [unclassified Campylobacter]|uniref:hypothetical protein n=1 Tax=unclassified Campylobacter TaxID=2593542 RepID=UPI001BDAFC7A|nr:MULTISPECIES: hypothetical protein [unclassified Campylobacter]MBZ7976520.1 hypothetical protein [Campylobacter sp. RM12637]MBZ7978110.1 hypothetical protein [Campylobacter sp. RM12654]MBZ7980006.1 hypothetical protein [Campylobacter sp. RM12642]MBZ7981403.1 hypothetical protein [Campylobacter sp. RM12640]MBZ7983809.1 hypothetical protein [Campylobacter sp. RM12647]MBZ7989001.1 hypothetical protein [Campylobacter sp. RM12635]MBZ7991221.1 hypothetical protein [Campylobacter sp. RM9331]MBZ
MKAELISSILLKGTQSGKISLANIKNPYGDGSNDVLSIAVCLKENIPEWKVHIPYENLDELIIALQSISGKRQ